MASSRGYLDYILESLSLCGAGDITYRAMMGEYIIYASGKVIGGIYDDRLLIKPVPSARALMPDAPEEIPYEGARPMLLCTDTDDAEFLRELIDAILPELPAPKKRKKA
ncbi:MAG: TfoX/Sxy family protein [Clostridia bacterium]|nr:TfoX/Sxy family protein [Clostridia bacterium]